MRKTLLIYSLLFLTVTVALGQEKKKFFEHIKIRKAFESNTDDDDKAANFSINFPAGGKETYLVNAGVGYSFLDSTWQKKTNDHLRMQSFTSFFVFNRNTELEKKQHNFKLGVTYKRYMAIDDNADKVVIADHTIEYLRNYNDTTHSAVVTSYWHYFSKRGKIKFGGYAQGPGLFAHFVNLKVGAEYQQAFIANSENVKGLDARVYYSPSLNILLKKVSYIDEKDPATKKPVKAKLPRSQWSKGLELVLSYEGRSSFASTVENNEAYKQFLKAELNAYLTPDNALKLGISYNKGSNPIDGLLDQDFWLVALSWKK